MVTPGSVKNNPDLFARNQPRGLAERRVGMGCRSPGLPRLAGVSSPSTTRKKPGPWTSSPACGPPVLGPRQPWSWVGRGDGTPGVLKPACKEPPCWTLCSPENKQCPPRSRCLPHEPLRTRKRVHLSESHHADTGAPVSSGSWSSLPVLPADRDSDPRKKEDCGSDAQSLLASPSARHRPVPHAVPPTLSPTDLDTGSLVNTSWL